METLRTDVLIIGSEGAGARAAIEACDMGAEVTLVTKGRLGRHGATVMAAADIAIDSRSLTELVGQGNPADNPRAFLEDMVIEGKWLNDQSLARLVVEEVPERARELLDWGLKYTEVRQMPGHRFPRSLYTSGPEMARTLSRQVCRRNIRVLEDTYLHDLLTRDGEVIGAVGLDLRQGRPIACLAKAVVLASGGCHSLYLHNTGADGLTGDGQAMAYRAGAELLNMEMTQFIPVTAVESSRARDSLFLFLLGPQNALRVWLLNKYGERFMARWDPQRMEHTTRDLLSAAIMTEILEGRGGPGGGVYYSLAHLPRNLVADFARWGAKPFLKPNWHAHGSDFHSVAEELMQGKAVEVVPAAHFFMGGLKVNEQCETTLPGLYAAGEVVGGAHGANRLSGTAFSQMLVLGKRAGHAAARRALTLNTRAEPEPQQVTTLEEKLLHPLQARGDVNPYQVKRKLQEIAWHRVGVVREGASLKTTLDDIAQIKKTELAGMASRARDTRFNLEWLECLQVENMLLVLEMITRSALLRQESRGAHYRKDFTGMDNRQWLANTVVRRTADGLSVSAEPVSLPLVKPASERNE
ncbi:MAG: FAD-binding protein [Chloroflexota bacterium]|nr:FAD-binding protein [Chloroflexota bacterium]